MTCGRGVAAEMVWTPPPAMLKLMVSFVPKPPFVVSATTSALRFAPLLIEVMASRRVTRPSTAMVSPVPVTVTVAAWSFPMGTERLKRVKTKTLRKEKKTRGVFMVPPKLNLRSFPSQNHDRDGKKRKEKNS